MPDRSKGMNQTKRDTLVLQVGEEAEGLDKGDQGPISSCRATEEEEKLFKSTPNMIII
jgi:hypothetical protein